MPDKYLPPELWLAVFHWATLSSKGYDMNPVAYKPFQTTPEDVFDSSITVRANLALVCRQWRNLTIQFLFKDIRIRHGAHALKHILEDTDHDKGFGRWVRRVVLPYPSTVTGPPYLMTSIEILNLCSNVETLVRPQFLLSESLRFEYDAGSLPLPSLKRLEWWHHNEADRSGGINSLVGVLRSAPNLQFLFVGGVVGQSRVTLGKDPLYLPVLETLRLHVVNGLLLRQIVSKWSLPALRRVIMDSPMVEHGLQGIWDAFGSQLRTVEFGKHLRFLIIDSITPCLRGCSYLEELNYFIFFTAPPEVPGISSPLTTIGLHAAVNSFLVDGPSIWNIIEQHFQAFTIEAFPNLRRILLYGQWRGITSHKLFTPVRERLHARGCTIETGADA